MLKTHNQYYDDDECEKCGTFTENEKCEFCSKFDEIESHDVQLFRYDDSDDRWRYPLADA